MTTETRKAETAGTRSKRSGPGDKNEMVERDEPEQKPKSITAEVYLDALWANTLGLARAGIENVQDKSNTAEFDGSQMYEYAQIFLEQSG